jgi:hypothetical protein
MRFGPKRGKRSLISRKAEIQLLAGIFIISAIPLIAVLWIVGATARPDLEGFAPIQSSFGDAIVLNWSALLHESSDPHETSAAPTNRRVRALGYMADGAHAVSDGTLVEDFVLLPDVGIVIHPVPRFGDQMIAVKLDRNSRVPFFARSLMWVTGTLHAISGNPIGTEPLYRLDGAHAELAKTEEITRQKR